MRILIFTIGFLPGRRYGGTPVSIDNFCSLMREHECSIVTRNHDLHESEVYTDINSGWNQRDNCRVLYLSDSEFKEKTFERIIDEIKPDIIYLQSVFQSCVIPCLRIAKQRKIGVLLAPRGELYKDALHRRAYKKIPYILLIRCMRLMNDVSWHSTSIEETATIEKNFNIGGNHIYKLDNIPSVYTGNRVWEKKSSGEGRFVYLSRIHPHKNLLVALECLNGVDGDVCFDIFGPLEDSIYWDECQREIEKLRGSISVNYKGIVEKKDVFDVLCHYDALLLPSASENFGHAIVESMLSGIPVIISDNTPWRNLEEHGAGWDCNLEERDSFQRAINKIISFNDMEMTEVRKKTVKYICDKINYDDLRESYNIALNAARRNAGGRN